MKTKLDICYLYTLDLHPTLGTRRRLERHRFWRLKPSWRLVVTGGQKTHLQPGIPVALYLCLGHGHQDGRKSLPETKPTEISVLPKHYSNRKLYFSTATPNWEVGSGVRCSQPGWGWWSGVFTHLHTHVTNSIHLDAQTQGLRT